MGWVCCEPEGGEVDISVVKTNESVSNGLMIHQLRWLEIVSGDLDWYKPESAISSCMCSITTIFGTSHRHNLKSRIPYACDNIGYYDDATSPKLASSRTEKTSITSFSDGKNLLNFAQIFTTRMSKRQRIYEILLTRFVVNHDSLIFRLIRFSTDRNL